MAEDLTLLHDFCEFRWHGARFTLRVPDVGRRLAWVPAIEPVGSVCLPVGPDLQHPFDLGKPVVPAIGRAATVLASTATIGDELVSKNFQRVLRLDHLDRLACHVRVDVGIAVQSISPWSASPGAAGKIDKDEWLAFRVITANGDASIASVGGRKHLVRHKLRQRAKQAVDHAKAG